MPSGAGERDGETRAARKEHRVPSEVTGDAAAREEAAPEEHFKPVGSMFILAIFVLTIILLWGSVYLILLSRGATT